VCFLAFVLWNTLELWQERAGLGKLATHAARRIRPHSSARRDSADTHARRDSTALCHAPRCGTGALLDRLGIVLPKRIRVPEIAVESAERTAA
jgi:hypothetical protein